MAEEASVPQANGEASARTMQAARLEIDPFDEAFLSDPYAYHDALREAGPVVWLESLGVHGLARYAPVQAALRDHETFCSGRGGWTCRFCNGGALAPAIATEFIGGPGRNHIVRIVLTF
jgi:cytochrome P450